MANQKVDVVIVGSGAAGSLLAATLAQADKSVVVLEGGPRRDMGDLFSSQIWSRRLKWGGPPTITGGKDPLSVGFASGWGTGGSAMHHFACWFRLHPEDFRMKTLYGRGLDWPVTYDDLRPFYDRIQREVGISGDAKQEVWRPAGDAYPMPPLRVFNQARVIARGFSKMNLRTAPLPMAINSKSYNGRPPCIYDGWCDAGCPIQALANPLATYLPRAQRSGCVVRNNSWVTRVLAASSGSRASGVEYYDEAGERQVQEASVVIVAAFAFQTPRLLLNSGVANSSGLVGRYMMAHYGASIFGMFAENTQNYLGLNGGQLVCQDNYTKDPKKDYFSGYQWLIANSMKPNDLLGSANSRPDLFGEALHEFVRDAVRRLATMTLMGEDLPKANNRLTLSDRTDRYGLPLAQVTHEYGPDEVQGFEAAVRQGKAIFEAAGARETWSGGRVTIHTMGGTIMGDDPKASVTNSFGQTHDVPNLFVAGSSLFPTSGAVNPTFTIHALGLRSAEYILKNWSSLAG